MNENNSKNNGEKFRKMLFNEISFLVAVCSLVIGITLFIVRPSAEQEKNIALIQQKINVIYTKM